METRPTALPVLATMESGNHDTTLRQARGDRARAQGDKVRARGGTYFHRQGGDLMNRAMRIWAGVALFLLVAVLPLQAADQAPKFLEPAELNRMIQRGEKPVLVNSASTLECMDCGIPGSLCIPAEEFAVKAPKLLPDKAVPLVFYCESNRCQSGGEAALVAMKQGYQRVWVLFGGIPAWKQAGYGTVSPEKIPRVPGEAIKAERLGQWLKEKRNPVILDVRGEIAFEKDHLPGAINIPLYKLQDRYQEIPLNRPVIVVDDRGLSSFLVASYLMRKGVADVKRLFGGMEKWQAYTAHEKQKK